MRVENLHQYIDNTRRKYRELVDRAEALMEAAGNICGFDENRLCARSRDRLAKGAYANVEFNCCGHPYDMDVPFKCPYLVPGEGCSVTCLFCKCTFCDFIKKRMSPDLVKEFAAIEKAVYDMELFDFRQPSGYTLVRKLREAANN